MKKLCLSLLLLFLLAPGHLLAQSGCSSNLPLNTTQSGIWEPDCDSNNRDGTYAKFYTFVLPTTELVVIDLASSVDTYMFLLAGRGENGSIIEVDDNDGAGKNSRVTQILAAGTYTIEATTRQDKATGGFTVRVSVEDDVIPPDPTCEHLVEADSKTEGSWDSNCTSTQRKGRYARYYTFTLESDSEVSIGVNSAQDSYLYLLEGPDNAGEVLAENNDAGIGKNSEISLDLPPGTYTIEATTYSKAATGTYKLFLDTEPPDCEDCPFEINAGLNDAWFNPFANGQGFNISVYPDIKQMFVTWFTFDTERPSKDVTANLGGPGQRWLTAQGPYDGNTAELTIYVTEGGVFESATSDVITDQEGDGTLTLEFSGCNEAMATYEIASLNLSDEIPLERIVLDNIDLCELLAHPLP